MDFLRDISLQKTVNFLIFYMHMIDKIKNFNLKFRFYMNST